MDRKDEARPGTWQREQDTCVADGESVYYESLKIYNGHVSKIRHA